MERRILLTNNISAENVDNLKEGRLSVADVIKKSKNMLFSGGYRNVCSDNQNVLHSLIASEKLKLYPLYQYLESNDNIDVINAFYKFVGEYIERTQPLGYIHNDDIRYIADECSEDFKVNFSDSNLLIFESELIKCSSCAIVLRGFSNNTACDVIINKKKLQWFNDSFGQNSRIQEYIDHENTNIFTKMDKIMLLLLNSLPISHDLIIPTCFLIII